MSLFKTLWQKISGGGEDPPGFEMPAPLQKWEVRRRALMQARESKVSEILKGEGPPPLGVLEKLIDEAGLDHEKSEILAAALPSIRMVALPPEGEGEFPSVAGSGGSHLGGLPHLPQDMPWPHKDQRPLSFLAQVDLEEMHAREGNVDLPATGLLLFFFDAEEQPWGFDPKDKGSSQVLHIPVPDNQRPLWENAPSDLNGPLNADFVFQKCRLVFFPGITVPNLESDAAKAMNLTSKEEEAFLEVVEEGLLGSVDEILSLHHLMGHSENMQGDMQMECQLASNGIYVGDASGYKSEKGRALASGARDWRLLLQLDSDEIGPGWMWGDAGRIYYWIRQADLAAGDFSATWTVLQCG
jgi:uncharacterized protein YwqG